MMVVIYAYLFHSDRKITCNNRYIQISALFYALCHVINRVLGISKNFVLSLQQKSDFRYLMEETKYNGPEMNVRKLFVLILTAALILMLFLTRTGDSDSLSDSDKGTTQQLTEQYLYISPFDSLFRLYADSVCDWKMLAAIAYVESKFDTTAKSHVGAMGLMQIMPDTGRELARVLQYPFRRQLLKDPEYNLALGQNYLLKLLNMPAVGENLMYLATAYNAGPGNLIKWKKQVQTTDPLLFLETIPSRETRSFVERIIVNYWIYRTLMNQPLQSLDAVATGDWPRYQNRD